MQFDSAIRSICRRRIEAKRLRGAKQVAIIAKAARLVLRNRARPDFFAGRTWRCYARCQAGNRSTHRIPDPCARHRRVETIAAAIRASYRGAGTRATDCTSSSGSAAGFLDDWRAASARTSTGDHTAYSGERGADATRISMHLFGAGNVDRVGRPRLVVELHSGAAVRARAVRELPAERKRAVGIHPARRIHGEPATANNLQWHGVHAARAGEHFGGAIRHPATLAGIAAAESVHAMCVQLTRANQELFSGLRGWAQLP